MENQQDKYGVNKTYHLLTVQKGLGYDFRIDQLYLEHGMVALKQLELHFLGDKNNFSGKDSAIEYLDKKIAKIEKEESDIVEQRSLDIKHKKRQLNFFYPLLVLTVISVSVSLFTAWNNYSKTESNKDKLKYLEGELKYTKESILFLTQKRKEDSIRNAKPLIQDSTKK